MTAMVEVDILRHVLGGADGEGGAVPGITVTCFPVMSFTTAVVDLAGFSAEFFLGPKRERGAGVCGAHPLQKAQRLGHPQSKNWPKS
jgi:hypothetical protein